jgi:hypothetical protein
MRHRDWKLTIRILSSAVLAAAIFCTLTALAQDTAPPPPPDSSFPSPQQPAADSNPDNVRAVRLSDVEGKVQVFHGNDVAFDQAQMNMPVVEGMRLATGNDGRVEVQFEDGSVARVTPNSSITFSQLHRNGNATVTAIDATNGLSYYELNGRSGDYSVHFGASTVVPTDSSIFRINLDATPEMAVTHGTVHLSDGQNLSLDVRTNQSVRFSAQDPGQYDVIQSVSADTWDQWNSDRDQDLAALDTDATTARASSGNPNDPAWNDLDYYGDWYNVPGYGEAWAPSGVDQNWDPFAVGSWGYYSGVGYSWISGYSWGWWPYHCGAWNWFDSYGWMWFPGNCGFGRVGAGWYPYATVWHIPPRYKLPVRPIGRPPHGPTGHPQPMVAVNRGQNLTQQFRSVGEPKPTPRPFVYEGKTIQAAQPTIHTQQGGPMGEGYVASAERTHPGLFSGYSTVGRQGNGFAGGTSGARISNDMRPAYQPGQLRFNQPPSYHPSQSVGAQHGFSGGNSGGSTPHYSAPSAPSFHSAAPSAPAASGGGHPH